MGDGCEMMREEMGERWKRNEKKGCYVAIILGIKKDDLPHNGDLSLQDIYHCRDGGMFLKILMGWCRGMVIPFFRIPFLSADIVDGCARNPIHHRKDG